MKTLAIHKTFDKDSIGDRSTVLYVADGKSVVKYIDAKATKFIASLTPGTTVRFSAVSAADTILAYLAQHGVAILHAHWHDLGIEKASDAETIALALSQAPAELFGEFKPDPKIAELRHALAMKTALDMFEGDARRRFLQIGRNMGESNLNDIQDPLLKASLDELSSLKDSMKYVDADSGRAVAWETRLTKIAKGIPHCVLFAEIAGLKSMGTAASIVAYANGVERFPNVASFWSYCGQSVVNGKAPKMRKGQPCTWSPKARTALYLLGVSILKMKDNPWNPVYRAYKADEMAKHDSKCILGKEGTPCKFPAGHCDAMARRKVVKEILKRFYLAATQQAYQDDHKPVETRELVGV
jgi:hypothetical protein